MIYALIAIAIGCHYHRRASGSGTNRWLAWFPTAAAGAAGIGTDLAIRFLGEVLFGSAFTGNVVPVLIATTTCAYAAGLPVQLWISERLIPEPPDESTVPDDSVR